MKYEICELNRKIIDIEKKNDLYNIKIKNIYIWDIVRYEVAQKIAINNSIYNEPHNYKNKTINLSIILEDIINIIKGIIKAKKNAIIYFAHNRRKLNIENNKWEDIYIDPLINEKNRFNIIEFRIKSNKHYVPIQNDVIYLDFIKYIINIIKLIFIIINPINKREKLEIIKIENQFKETFKENINIYKLIIKRVYQFLISYKIYKYILKYLKPSKIFITTSYGKEDLIKAARELKIPIIEIQHGIINKNHLGYYYEHGKKHYIPNEILLFGPIWSKYIIYNNTIELNKKFGFPYLKREYEKYKKNKKENQILVISQGTIGKELFKKIIQISKYIDDNIKIIYKLHPGEYYNWEKRYYLPKDLENRIKIISDDKISMYYLMSKSKWQIGVNSTALFEGLVFGCKTILINLPGIEDMDDLIKNKNAIILDKPNKINEILKLELNNDYTQYFSI